MEHWHLYMDEGGTFERLKRNDSLYIYCLLIKDSLRISLENKFKDIVKDISNQLHAFKFYKHGKNRSIANDIISLTKKSNIIIARIEHKYDIFYKSNIRESLLSNRFLFMLNDIIEHIIFLYPEFWKRKLCFSLHPNSRIVKVKKDSPQYFEYLRMGFSGRPVDKNKYIFYIFDADIIRTDVINMQKEYEQFTDIIGDRIIDNIETLRGDTTEDIFSYWVDHLAYFSRSVYFNELKEEIDNLVEIDLQYGELEQLYKKIAKCFMAKRLSDCLTLILDNSNKYIGNKYYRKQIENIGNLLLKYLKLSFNELHSLESKVNFLLRSASGRWSFVSDIIEFMLKALESLPKSHVESHQIEITKLLKKIYSHKLSIHNHRSEFLGAYQTAQKIAELQKDYFLSFDELRQDIEIRNRIAIAYANMFEFQKSNESLKRDIEFLLEQKTRAQSVYNREIKDVVLGKLYGTIGQNYAFLAPFNPELFSKAEDCFNKAKSEFSKESDKQRQDVYLLHLYYDWTKIDAFAFEKGKNLLKELVSLSDVQRFLNNPTPENAKYKQFLLQLLLNYNLDAEQDIVTSFLNNFSLSRLKYLFKDAADEHPFEFIFAYLGIMSMKIKRYDNARDYFAYAIRIPLKGRRIQQPTLQAIRAQILTRYAMELYKIGQEEEARNKMVEAVKIMEQLGRYPEYAPILQLKNGKAIGGWFKDAWNSLSKMEWNKDFDLNTCEMFLKYFTFNYA